MQDRNILLYRDNFVALRQKHGERKPDIARSCNCDFQRDVLALFAGKIKGRLRVPQSETRKQIFDLRCKGRKPCDTHYRRASAKSIAYFTLSALSSQYGLSALTLLGTF